MSAALQGHSEGDLEMVRLLLTRLGVAPEQLLSSSTRREQIPRLGVYIDRVAAAVTDGTRRAYSPYWMRAKAEWGERLLNEPTPLEIKQLAERTKVQAVIRRNSRGGRNAAEHMISALRCVYQFAVDDGLILEGDNPARRVPKPHRLPGTRFALPDHRLSEINRVAGITGNDPQLDSLLLRLHEETACRRGGALALRPQDLDQDQCLILLREKGGTSRWQPVSPTLMGNLLLHIEERGHGDPSDQLLRYRNGQPITYRRYDHLWDRLGKQLQWVATHQVSTHWLRYTTLTWVERRFGYATARGYAGHNGRNDAGTTATYVLADLYEIAAALSALTNEPHPLAPVSATAH